MIHSLKCNTLYFDDVISGKKTFEVRKNDCEYKVGDYLALNEYDAKDKSYTGASCLVYVDYILDSSDYCKDGYVVMSIKPCAVRKYGSPSNEMLMYEDYSVPLASYENK